MARTLPGSIGTEIAKPITTPVYLIRLVINADLNQVLRMSTRQSIGYGGVTYLRGDVAVGNLTDDQTTITIGNHDLAGSALALDGNLREHEVIIYQTYTSAASTADAVVVFRGIVDSVAQVTMNRVTINCRTEKITTLWTPRIFCTPPLCNHMPPSGTKIGDYILEPATNR